MGAVTVRLLLNLRLRRNTATEPSQEERVDQAHIRSDSPFQRSTGCRRHSLLHAHSALRSRTGCGRHARNERLTTQGLQALYGPREQAIGLHRSRRLPAQQRGARRNRTIAFHVLIPGTRCRKGRDARAGAHTESSGDYQLASAMPCLRCSLNQATMRLTMSRRWSGCAIRCPSLG